MSDSDRGERSQALGQSLGVLLAIFFVALIVGFLAYSSGIEGERRNQYPAAYAKAAKEDARRACIGGESSAIFECVYERVEASQNQATAKQDLDAQQGMKFWAAVMAFIALGTLILTGIALWFIRGTLIETAKMANDTKDMATASIDATKAMLRQNDLAIAAQRPWITLAVSDVRILKRGASTLISYQAEALNCGREAAHNFNIRYSVFNASEGIRRKMDECLERLRSQENNLDLSLAPTEQFAIGSWAFQHTNSIPPMNNMEWGPVIHPFILVYARYTDSIGAGCEAFRVFRLAFETGVEKIAPSKREEVKAHSHPIEEFIPLGELPIGPDRLRTHTIYSKTT